MNVKKIMIEAGKISLSAVVGHSVGKMARDSVLKSSQIYEMDKDTIRFNKKPDGIHPIVSKSTAVYTANCEYFNTAVLCSAGAYLGFTKIEEVVTDHLENRKMKKVSEVISEETTSETPVTEEVTEE